ncbi:hypothetical protein NC651_016735 [Populus alba x Populus x berolinensis]|nr:hypothetical protein NC651_016735 [Populus alba x Populus x berolinensis]
MGSLINGNSSSFYAKGNSSRINATVSVLLRMQRDAKVQQILYSYKEEIDHISRSICSCLMSMSMSYVSLFLYCKRSINKVRKRVHHLKGRELREERLKVQLAFIKSNTPYAYWSS